MYLFDGTNIVSDNGDVVIECPAHLVTPVMAPLNNPAILELTIEDVRKLCVASISWFSAAAEGATARRSGKRPMQHPYPAWSPEETAYLAGWENRMDDVLQVIRDLIARRKKAGMDVQFGCIPDAPNVQVQMALPVPRGHVVAAVKPKPSKPKQSKSEPRHQPPTNSSQKSFL